VKLIDQAIGSLYMIIARAVIAQILKNLNITREQLDDGIDVIKSINIKNSEGEILIDLKNIEIKIKKNEKTPQ
jgi:hypothetical protein